MTAYYNENDREIAAWLRELIKAGHIAPGDVDERSIEDVLPDDLVGYTQCHFFAGIGGWSYALRLAGWPDDRPVWTGSCPCQPFSAAGKGTGFSDERHLWPAWFHLIEQRRPSVIFGEQVEKAIKHGWLDLVQSDLEGIGYAVAPVGIPAAGIGAPHIRQRLYFVAETSWRKVIFSADCDEDGNCPVCGIDFGDCECPGPTQDDEYEYEEFGGILCARELGNSIEPGLERYGRHGDSRHESGRHAASQSGPASTAGANDIATAVKGYWRDADWLFCRDGNWRAVESGTFPLAHGIPARMGRLRGYGNAIVPQVAQALIEAYLERKTS